MPDYRRILVPVDFSPASERALALAATLGAHDGATIQIVYAWEPPAYLWHEPAARGRDPSGEAIAQIAGLLASDSMKATLRALAVRRDVRVRHRVEPGAPTDVIVATARAVGADLIVMGTHGRTGLARAAMGSVAEHVVRHAPCPVLTTHAPTRGRGATDPGGAAAPPRAEAAGWIHRILVPTDYSEGSRAALAHAVGIAGRFGATVDVLHVWEATPAPPADVLVAPPEHPSESARGDAREGAQRSMADWMASVPRDEARAVGSHVERGPAGDRILAAAAHDCDLIVMATSARTGLARWLAPSMTERVVRRATVPVLAVPRRAHATAGDAPRARDSVAQGRGSPLGVRGSAAPR